MPVLNKSTQIDCKWLEFNNWWNSKIIVSKTEKREIIFTREKISLTMAEQDGGVHIDSFENVEKDYRDVALSIANIFTRVDLQGNETPIKYLQYALVRQISHELIISILKEFKFNLDYHPTNKINLRGVPESNIIQPGLLTKNADHISTRTKTPYKIRPCSSFEVPPGAAYLRLRF